MDTLRWIQIVCGLLLILVPTTSVSNSTSTSNIDLQQVEEDEDGNVKESQKLRKKPLQVKEEEGNNNNNNNNKAKASSSLNPLMSILGGVQQDDLNYPSLKEDEDLLEPEQMQMVRSLVKRKREKESEASDAGENEDEDDSLCLEEQKCEPWYEPNEKSYDYPEDEASYDFKKYPEDFPDISYDFDVDEVDDEERCTTVGAEFSKDKPRSKQDKQSFSASSRDVSVIVATETTLPSQTALAYSSSLLEESYASLSNANTLRAQERDASLAILHDLQSRVVITQDAINSGSAQGAGALDVASSALLSIDDLKAIDTFCGQLAGLGNFLNSGDLNTQFRASMRVAAQFALVIGNAVSPPAGFIVSSLFNLAGLLNPWSSPAGQTLDDLLNDAITQGFIQFQDQLLTDELNRVRADMRAQSRQLDDYTQLPLVEPRDALIVTARDQIYSLFNNNNDDAYKFMDVLGDNIDYFDERNSEMMGNRIVSLLQIGRQRITICRRRASLFSRLTNGENPEDVDSVNRARLDFRRAQFWNEVEVEATKSSLRRYLGPMMNPPSRTESGISRVLRAWHQIQSHDQRENLEEFMHEELGLKMPGKVLMVRNLSHNHYMEASRGACPRNLNWPGNPGYNREGRDCPWLETTPLSAGQNTRSNKLFRVYGNRVRFTLWHLSTHAYIRQQTSFMPTFNNNGRARWFYDFNQFPTSRLPLLHQIEPQPITRSGAENGIPQWQFHYWPNEDRIGSPRMIGAPSSCLEFVVGPRRTVSSSGATGDSLFSRCVWDASFAGTVEWAVYSTNWGTQERNGNSRGRNQVLLWTQKNQQCCVSDGRSDTVTQGIWRFEHLSSNPALHGAEFRLPSSGQL